MSVVNLFSYLNGLNSLVRGSVVKARNLHMFSEFRSRD